MADTETEYYMHRAKEEAKRALTSDQPAVAAAHHGLSVQYSARALMSHVEELRARVKRGGRPRAAADPNRVSNARAAPWR